MTKFPFIALLGHARSGKDTAGKLLIETGGGTMVAFADKIKQICAEMFDVPINDFYDNEKKEQPTKLPCHMCPKCGGLAVNIDPLGNGRKEVVQCLKCGAVGETKVFSKEWTPRMMAQHIGTEGFRAIDPMVWASYAIRNAKKTLEQKRAPKFVVFTDTRFRSECELIWANGGEVWRIVRPGADGNAIGGIAKHASEVEQESIKDGELQAIIQNDGTLESLKARLLVQLNRFTRGE